MDFLKAELPSNAPERIRLAKTYIDSYVRARESLKTGEPPLRVRPQLISFDEIKDIFGIYMSEQHAELWAGVLWCGTLGIKTGSEGGEK